MSVFHEHDSKLQVQGGLLHALSALGHRCELPTAFEFSKTDRKASFTAFEPLFNIYRKTGTILMIRIQTSLVLQLITVGKIAYSRYFKKVKFRNVRLLVSSLKVICLTKFLTDKGNLDLKT